jgi:UDP-N-acetylglucosamine:LPS N-acetylglucosamine transferase
VSSVELAGAAALRARAGTRRSPVSTSTDERPASALRLALAGGGTGGHVLPGVHLIEHGLLAGGVGDLVWFQTGRAVEETAMGGFAQILGETAFERSVLHLEPEGGGAPSLSRLALLTAPATLAARRALVRHRSQVLLGLGGYTSLPAVLAARSLGVPIALLEINAVRGRATDWLQSWARRVFHAWPGTLPEHAAAAHDARDLWTGPPLSAAFQGGDVDERDAREARSALGFEPDAPLLLVLGGSQGALGLNRFMARFSGVLAERGVNVLHQTGPGRLAEGAEERRGYRSVEFMLGVDQALRAATLVLCRGGASTLAEVGAVRRPAWVVPYPHHADRHQERNARQLGQGVRIVQESELDEERARELARLCGRAGAERRAEMSAALAGRVPLDGAQRIWRELQDLARSAPPRIRTGP